MAYQLQLFIKDEIVKADPEATAVGNSVCQLATRLTLQLLSYIVGYWQRVLYTVVTLSFII